MKHGFRVVKRGNCTKKRNDHNLPSSWWSLLLSPGSPTDISSLSKETPEKHHSYVTHQIQVAHQIQGSTCLTAGIILSIQKAHLIFCSNATFQHPTHSGLLTANWTLWNPSYVTYIIIKFWGSCQWHALIEKEMVGRRWFAGKHLWSELLEKPAGKGHNGQLLEY